MTGPAMMVSGALRFPKKVSAARGAALHINALHLD
jgi:hypothetical protein